MRSEIEQSEELIDSRSESCSTLSPLTRLKQFKNMWAMTIVLAEGYFRLRHWRREPQLVGSVTQTFRHSD